MDAKLEVLAAKINYEMCKALTPASAWRESAADTILQQLFARVFPASDGDVERDA